MQLGFMVGFAFASVREMWRAWRFHTHRDRASLRLERSDYNYTTYKYSPQLPTLLRNRPAIRSRCTGKFAIESALRDLRP